MAEQETIAVLGAGGTMGAAMARNLLKAGYGVRAWNRSRDKAEPLAEDGAEICDSPAAAADGATVILTMLADGEVLQEAMADVASAGTSRRPVWLQMSTVGEGDTDRAIALAADRRFEFVDAPVSGTKAPAEEGTLVILASGPDALRDRLQPIFDVVGHKTIWAGAAGAGTRLKLAVNSWLLCVVEGAAETLALAEGIGLDPQLVLDAIKDGPLDSDYLQLKGASMIERSFDPSFTLKLATKDAGLVTEATRQHDLDLPVLTAIRERFESGVADHGEEDLSVTFLTSAPAHTAH